LATQVACVFGFKIENANWKFRKLTRHLHGKVTNFWNSDFSELPPLKSSALANFMRYRRDTPDAKIESPVNKTFH
jgi:hypothetical protein